MSLTRHPGCAASNTSCWRSSWPPASLGNLTFLILDPITLIYRTIGDRALAGAR